ncbi:MAG: vitamin K epoxide reductase family protein [Gemmataceae bacterium]|nr:vitamin K epoxide reductase family protein [Gemmataceae bacterium]
MTPRRLSHELREETSPDLRRRRWVIGLSLLGVAAAKVVPLYQTGLIRRLPDPPLPKIDSNKVNASDYAYKRLQTPDGLLMLVNYAVTAAVAGAGGKDRARDQPWLVVATGAKTVYDVITCLTLGVEEWQANQALCAYCQAATGVSIASAALALPEAVRAVNHLLGGSGEQLQQPAGRGVGYQRPEGVLAG